jgi:hypothetical protein
MYWKLLLLSIVVMAIVFAGLAIKMFFKKDGEFKKQCSTIDPHTGRNLGCSCEGTPSDGSCRKEDDEHHHNHHHKHASPVLTQIKEFKTN